MIKIEQKHDEYGVADLLKLNFSGEFCYLCCFKRRRWRKARLGYLLFRGNRGGDWGGHCAAALQGLAGGFLHNLGAFVALETGFFFQNFGVA